MIGPAMFKNKEFRVKMVDTKKETEDTAPVTIEERIGTASNELIAEIAKDILKRTAIVVGGVIVAIKIVDTLGEIAVKKTKSADKN
jgi:hypothetical protein